MSESLKLLILGGVIFFGFQSGGIVSAEEAAPVFIEEVYLTPEQALKRAFPSSEKIEAQEIRLTPEQKSRVERRLGWRLTDGPFTVHRGFTGGRLDGYAMVAEEIGKFKPITFMVKAAPDFRVESVEVMVYRESRGAEVRRSRFLHQFKDKSARSPLRINRDVINITGATLSVRAMAAGVKRVLCVLEEVYAHP